MANLALGFKGFAKVNGDVLPFTRCTIAARHNTLEDEGVHGGGASGVGDQYHSEILAATGPIFYDGDFDTYIFGGSGDYATALRAIITNAITTTRDAGFATGAGFVINMGTTSTYEYPGNESECENKAIVNSLSIRGASEALVTFSANIWSTTRRAGGSAPAVGDYTYEDPCRQATDDDYNPLPYHGAILTFSGGCSIAPELASEIITNWELTVTNNAVRIVTFNNSLYAKDIGVGIMQVTGNFQYYGPAGVFTDGDDMYHGTTLTINLQSMTLTIPFLWLEERPVESAGRNEIVQRTINFRGLATSSQAALVLT